MLLWCVLRAVMNSAAGFLFVLCLGWVELPGSKLQLSAVDAHWRPDVLERPSRKHSRSAVSQHPAVRATAVMQDFGQKKSP